MLFDVQRRPRIAVGTVLPVQCLTSNERDVCLCSVSMTTTTRRVLAHLADVCVIADGGRLTDAACVVTYSNDHFAHPVFCRTPTA